MKVKVCGITRLEDALLACDLGAWAVGFIFAPQSPRYVTPEAAAKIAAALPAGVECVGVFVDSTIEELKQVRASVGLSVVQLHGQEGPEVVANLGGRVIKAIRARSAGDIEGLDKFSVEAFLIDGPRSGRSGDWEAARAAKRFGRLILAGGLHTGNIAEAVASVSPYAVDLSSGLEASPGVKDPAKMKAFFERVRQAERERR